MSRPLSHRLFPDQVVFFRHQAATGGQGGSRRTFPFPGVPLAASVTSSTADRQDGRGMTFVATIHSIMTAEDPGAVADDKFEWLGRTLAVEGPSIPKGVRDVAWATPTREVS